MSWFSPIFTAPWPWGGVNPHLGMSDPLSKALMDCLIFSRVGKGAIPLCQLGQAGFGGDRGARSDTWYLGCSASSLQGAKVWQALAAGCLKCLLLARPCSCKEISSTLLLNRQFLLSQSPWESFSTTHKLNHIPCTDIYALSHRCTNTEQ